MKTSTLLTILISFVVFLSILACLILFLSQYGTHKILEEYCEDMGGTLNYYECFSAPLISDCSKVKTGFWCDFLNNNSISEDEIWRLINSTN